MRQKFVIFFSPGTFFSEQTELPIFSHDVSKAIEMAHSIVERYGARPYGFVFTTRERKDDELDSKEVYRSGVYYLGGRILTLAEVEARNDPKDEILLSNMRCNGFDRIVENRNSWLSTQPFREGDVLLDVTLKTLPEKVEAKECTTP